MESKRKKNGYGDFGNLSQNYARARKEFPEDVIAYIFEKIGISKPRILDLGCGTGIATNQLCENGALVVGTDIDKQMIQQAQSNNPHDIKYFTAPAHKQPFNDNVFDAVTAFSAFHWFANKETLGEIKRVLKPRGFFFIINKNETGDFKKKNKEILKRFIAKEMPDAKQGYDPRKTLEENGLQSIGEEHFRVSEYFSIGEAIEYIRTMSIWNLVPNNKKGEVLKILHNELPKRVNKDGKLERNIDVVVVFGTCRY